MIRNVFAIEGMLQPRTSMKPRIAIILLSQQPKYIAKYETIVSILA